MKITKKADIFNLVTELKNILDRKPPHEQMLKEVQMMKFKIRPLVGDVSMLNFKNMQLIETLWGLGKIDDFFFKEAQKISIKDQRAFFQIISQVRKKLETQLNKISFKKPIDIPTTIEMEIFKENPRKKN